MFFLGWPRLWFMYLFFKKHLHSDKGPLLLLLTQQRPSDNPAGRSHAIYITRHYCAISELVLRSDDKTKTCSLFHNSVHPSRFLWQQRSVSAPRLIRVGGSWSVNRCHSSRQHSDEDERRYSPPAMWLSSAWMLLAQMQLSRWDGLKQWE